MQLGRQLLVCERLRALGFTSQRKVRLYGEELHLISGPAPDGEGYTVEGVTSKSKARKRVRVPLPVVLMVEREIALKEKKARVVAA